MRREEARLTRRGAPVDIYRKAAEGWPVPGVNVPYEEPLDPELTLDSSALTVAEELEAVTEFLERTGAAGRAAGKTQGES